LARRLAKTCRCPAPWPRNATWVTAIAKNAAISNWYQERPSRPKPAQPAANNPIVMVIFAM
jgi:hypothetical protein